MIVRPGPEAIEPGANPGGVVIRVYEVPSQRLLTESWPRWDDDPRIDAEAARILADARLHPSALGFCLVAYDGDTGARFAAEEWQQR